MTRSVVGAHYGLRGWLVQRVTAVVLAAAVLFLAGLLAVYGPLGYTGWRRLLESGVTRPLAVLCWTALSCHAWIGVRNIVMDYVRPAGLRLVLHSMALLALVLYLAWFIQVLWSV